MVQCNLMSHQCATIVVMNEKRTCLRFSKPLAAELKVVARMFDLPISEIMRRAMMLGLKKIRAEGIRPTRRVVARGQVA